MPQMMNSTSNDLYYFNENSFEITSNIECDIIEENKNIYKNVLFPPNSLLNTNFDSNEKYLSELKIEIRDPQRRCPQYPDSNMDESCNY